MSLHASSGGAEERLHDLTESLIHKQTLLEQLNADKHSLQLQLDKTEVCSQLLVHYLVFVACSKQIHRMCMNAIKLGSKFAAMHCVTSMTTRNFFYFSNVTRQEILVFWTLELAIFIASPP